MLFRILTTEYIVLVHCDLGMDPRKLIADRDIDDRLFIDYKMHKLFKDYQ